MDNKQKKKFLNSIYKGLLLFIIASIAWTFYFAIQNINNATYTYLWLDIVLMSLSGLTGLLTLLNIIKNKKLQNVYSATKVSLFLSFISIIGMIVGVWYMYFNNLGISSGYVLSVIVVLVAQALLVILFVLSMMMSNLIKNSAVQIGEISEVPTYDEEIMLKKQLSDLNRKLEIKKVTSEIEKVKQELEEF